MMASSSNRLSAEMSPGSRPRHASEDRAYEARRRGHRPLVLNWLRAKGQLSSGVVEGFNAKAKLATRKPYGFQTDHGLEVTCIIHLAPRPSQASPSDFPGC
jgi:Transposase